MASALSVKQALVPHRTLTKPVRDIVTTSKWNRGVQAVYGGYRDRPG
jgi:hypothetical protein